MLLHVDQKHNYTRAINELLKIFYRNTDDPLAYRYGLDPSRRTINIELGDQNHIMTSEQIYDLAAWAKKYS